MSISAPISTLGVGDGAGSDVENLRDESRYGFGRPNFQTRGQLTIPVHFRGETSVEMAKNYQRLARKVRQAAKAWWERDRSKRVVFTWQPRTTTPVYFDVTGGALTPLHINPLSKSGECVLVLRVLPYPRGAALPAENWLNTPTDLTDGGWWPMGASIASNTVTAPDGTLTADVLVEDTSTGSHQVGQAKASLADGTYTWSIYAKAAGRTEVTLFLFETPSYALAAGARFDLTTGTVVSSTAGTAQITAAGNGWYRCSVTGAIDETGADPQVQLASGGTNNYTGDGASGVALWGGQLQSGSTVGPLVIAGAATLAQGHAGLRVFGVPGDQPALVRLAVEDVSATGAINRIRLSLRSADTVDLAEYDAWVAASALAPGAGVLDATRFDAGYIGATTSTTSWSNLCRATMPSGSLNRGRRDIWAMLYDATTAMDQPTGGAGSATAPTVTSTSSLGYNQPVVRQTGQAQQSGSSASVTLTGVEAGALLIAIVRTSSFTAGNSPGSTPGGYSREILVGNYAASGQVQFAVHQRRNVTAGTHTVTVSSLSTATGNNATLTVLEITNGDAIVGYAFEMLPSATTDEPTMTISMAETTFDNELVLAAVGSYFTASPSADFWFGGYDKVDSGTHQRLLVGSRVFDSAGTVPPPVRVRTSATSSTWGTLGVNIKPTRSTTSSSEVVEPTPGEVRAGTYAFRIQAVDPAGGLSNASASIDVTVTADRSSVTLTWTAPSGVIAYYKITYSLGGRYYVFYTPNNLTSYTLTTTEGHPETSGLPATTGALGPPARLRLRLGTKGTPSADLIDLDEVILPGLGAWRLVRLASAVDLPPVGMHLAGDQPEWALEAQIRSANGLSTEVRLDAFWVIPHDEWQATLEVPGLGETTKRRWLIETDLSGRAMSGWLTSTSDGSEVGQLNPGGAFLLEPGDNLILLSLEQAGGLASLDAACTVTLSISPRYDWIDGSLV